VTESVKTGPGIAVFALVFFATAYAQDPPVLAANFDLVLSVGDAVYTARNNAMVRSGNEIPVELGNFKVGLRLTASPDHSFSIHLPVYEKTDSSWYQTNVPTPVFDGELGAPVEILWESAGLEVELAIIVGLTDR